MKPYAVATIMLVVLFAFGCGPPTVSDEGSKIRFVLRSMASTLRELDSSELGKFHCMEQIFLYSNPTANIADFYSRGSTWYIVDQKSGHRLDYQVHPNPARLPDNEAIFVATPRAIFLDSDDPKYLVLTYALEVKSMTPAEYHALVLAQCSNEE